MTGTAVTRGDIEAKLAEIHHAVGEQAEGARGRLIPAGIAAVILLLLVAYLLGRRRGRKKTTIVEIRRV